MMWFCTLVYLACFASAFDHEKDLWAPHAVAQRPRANYSTMFLYHTRKSSGTTLRGWAKQMAKQQGMKLIVQEGVVLDTSVFRNPTYLFVTSLRPPIDRILSSYVFEGRWSQISRNRTTHNATPLDVWINKTVKKQNNHHRRVWQCVQNCYCTWFGGLPNAACGEVRMMAALNNLNQFHFVVDTTRLQKNIDSLHKQLGWPTIQLKRRWAKPNPSSTWHDAFNISESSMLSLLKLNNQDQVLYETVTKTNRVW